MMIFISRLRSSTRWASSGCSRSLVSESVIGSVLLDGGRRRLRPVVNRLGAAGGRLRGVAEAGADLGLDLALVILDRAQYVLVVQLAANIIEAEFAVHFLVGATQSAFDATEPQTGETNGFGQPLGADDHQRDHGDEQQFGETDVKHGQAPSSSRWWRSSRLPRFGLFRPGCPLVAGFLLVELVGPLVVLVGSGFLIGDGLAETLDGAAEIAADALETLGAENQHHDRQND